MAADECSRDSQFVAFAETDEDFLDHKSSVKASGTRDDGRNKGDARREPKQRDVDDVLKGGEVLLNSNNQDFYVPIEGLGAARA